MIELVEESNALERGNEELADQGHKDTGDTVDADDAKTQVRSKHRGCKDT
ncbi:hypothetical protein M404DRAFT_35863 [Pisolithus tinctorius Marx 270]|uniref:Uncharacterized protein n=1 Tax=Pisolithus tinctorius Marx 270 TaxID=870435 RepID=A0A0C3MXQ4_PISTI|nr:hypothetical protein M404DRAFT_35863 [Pisolithus tinctorius Marx 270]